MKYIIEVQKICELNDIENLGKFEHLGYINKICNYMKDIKKGDNVIGIKGEPIKVLEVFPQGLKSIYKIHFSDGSCTECCDEHLWEVQKYTGKKSKTQVLQLSEIRSNYLTKRGDSIFYVKVAEPVKYPEKELPLDPYMIGYWLGDGTSRGSSITTQESCVLHYFRKHLPVYNLYLSKLKSNYSYGITGDGKYGGNSFLTTLKKLDLINNKHIPYMYKCNSRQIRLKLLAGILDADGHYGSGGFELTQSYEKENLINDIVYLVRSLGFSCYKNLKNTSWIYKGERKYSKAWRLMIYGNGIEEIPTVCKRKRAKSRKQIKDPLVTGISVKYVGRDDYYGFTLDGNGRFVLENFMITHNTSTILSVACQLFGSKNIDLKKYFLTK